MVGVLLGAVLLEGVPYTDGLLSLAPDGRLLVD